MNECSEVKLPEDSVGVYLRPTMSPNHDDLWPIKHSQPSPDLRPTMHPKATKVNDAFSRRPKANDAPSCRPKANDASSTQPRPRAEVEVDEPGRTEFRLPGEFAVAEGMHGVVEGPLVVVEPEARGVEHPANVHHHVARLQHGRVARPHHLRV